MSTRKRSLGATALLLVGAAALSACAARASSETLPRRYDCDVGPIYGSREGLVVDGSTATKLSDDDDGEHYIVLGSRALVEYVVPEDPRADLAVRTYDFTTSPNRGDWVSRGRGLCVVLGGYTDALQRFMKGASAEEIAVQLSLNPVDAQRLIAKALSRLRRRIVEF